MTTQNNTFKVLNASQFAGKLKSLFTRKENYTTAVQELALNVVFFAVAHNDTRKADQVFSTLDPLHAKAFATFIMGFSGMVRITKKDRTESQKTDKPISDNRHFKLSDAKKAKEPGSEGALSRASDVVAAMAAHDWLTWKKPSGSATTTTTAKPSDFGKDFGTFLQRMSDKEITEGTQGQYKAFQSVASLIQEGKTLDQYRAEVLQSAEANLRKRLEKQIRAELEAELTAKIAENEAAAIAA